MLSSGVETQPVPLGSSMSAVVQELYSGLSVSVSKELHAEQEPSMTPDLKPGASSSPISHGRASPQGLQRTHAEGCCEESSETVDYGGKTGWCELVDPTRGPMAYEVLDREERPKSMEPKVFRDQGDQAQVFRGPCEGAKEDPCQHSTTTKEKICPSQDLLLIQSSKGPVCADRPGDARKNRGNVHNTAGTLPEPTEERRGNSTVSKMSKGKEESCDLHPVYKEEDNHQQSLRHHKEKHSSAHDGSIAPGSIDAITPSEENSKILCLTPYLSGSKSLEKCGFESSGLTKASAEKTHKVDQSQDFTCREERTVESSNHSNCHTLAGCPCIDSCSSMLNSPTEATEITFKKNDVKITLNLDGNLINSEDHRKTVVDVTHPEENSEESSFSLLVHTEDPEQTTVKSSALNGKIYSKVAQSVVSLQRKLGDCPPNEALCNEFLPERKPLQSSMPEDPVSSEHNEISKSKEGTAKLPSSPEKPVQPSQDSISHFDGPITVCEISECSPNGKLVAHKIEHECISHQQVSLSSQDHVTADSLLSINREMPSAACKDVQESRRFLENGVNVTPDTQTIPAETKTEAMSPQGDKACGASSFIQTLNIKTSSSEGQKEMTSVHSTFLSSVRGAAGSSLVRECQNVQSRDLFSCHCITQDASEENMCSACAAYEPSKDILKVSNCKIKCGNASQRPEEFAENSTLLESEPAGREMQSSILGGTVRGSVTAAVSHSAPLNAAAHVETGDEGLVGKKQDQHRDTEIYKHSISAGDTQELSQSVNIPSPETVVDQSLSVISSHFKAMPRAAGSLHQKAGEVSDCQSSQNSLDKCRCEGKPAREGLNGDYRETLPEVSHKQKDRIVCSGSKVPLSCGSLKQKDPKRAFKNIPGSEEFTHSMLDVVCPDCRGEPTEGVQGLEASSLSGHCTRHESLAHHETLRSTSSLRGELNVVFIGTPGWHSELPNAAASTVDSPEMEKSHEEKVCKSLKDYEVEECPDSAIDHEVKSIEDHEPQRRAPEREGVSLNDIHCEHQGKGGSMTEGLRLETNSEFGKKKTFGLSLKDSVSPGCQDSIKVVHSRLSSLEHSPADVPGEMPNLKHHFKPKDGKVLCENVKDCTVLSDMKEGIPMDSNNPCERDSTYVSVDSNACKACHSHRNSTDKHLPLTMETAIKVNKEETEEHQKGLLGHIAVGEAAEETITRAGHDGNSQTHVKCQRVQNVAETPQNQGVVDSALPKEECAHQKGTQALSEQHTSANLLSDEMRSKKQPVADQDESLMMGEVTLRKPTKDKIARQLQRLKSPKEESLCPSLKKDTQLYTGTCLPGTSWKEGDPTFAGGDRIHGAFVTLSYPQRLLPVKKQPHRTCKRISCQEPVTVRRKISKVRNSDCGKSFSNPVPTKAHRLLSPCTVPAKPLEPETVALESLRGHTPKPKATLCHSLRSLSCRKPTKESALLDKLSVLASKLTLAAKPQRLRCRRYSSSLVPLAKNYKRLRYKKLLDGFSHNAVQLDPYLAATGWSRGSHSRPLALYSLEAVKISFIDLSNKMPSLLLGTENAPFSFHVKSASSCMAESSRTFPEHCAPSRLALTEASPCSPPSPKWTFSFFLSHGCPGVATFREDTGLSSQTHTQAPLRDYGGTAIVQTRADCSGLGLHTLLALCSPGCYRIWTKRRNFSSHMPTMQRLLLTQFTQGLKGLRSPASIADKVFSSLPYSVGRVLSIWSQHGPSCTFKLPALHSPHSKQQGSLSALSSHTTIPNVPLPGMEAAHNTNSSHLRLEPVFPALVPKSCLVTEPSVSTLLLSASELQVPAFDELDGVSAACPRPQSSPAQQEEAEPEKRPKKVSQIRIRKTIPKPDPNLTPMGLPRPKRLKKKEFSLEEIYTNKNYKSPPASRCLETIFEEPKERNGTLISISQQKRKRVLEFPDFTVPRKRRARGKVKLAGSFTRAQKAALQTRELDALLIQKLMDLETFFAKEEEQEHQPAAENSSGSLL